MNRGAGRQPVFFADEDRLLFGRLLGLAHDRFGVEVHGYCLMTNHHHLLLRCPNGHLSEAMQLIGSVYTREVNDRVGRDGPLFRGRFRSITITSDDQLLRTIRYLHRNPLDVAGITTPAEYRWSSHRTYLGWRRPPAFVRVDEVLAHFDGDRDLFDRFVSDDTGSVSGTDVASLPAVVELVLEEVLGDGLAARLDRTVLALLLDELDPADAERLRPMLGYASPGAEAAARRRARRRHRSDPTLGTVVDRVLDLSRRTNGV
jgi:REP element-mobilizing transposase RayT